MKTLMSFQAYLPGMDAMQPWNAVTPVVHEFESEESGIEAAYALSKQLSNVTVRVVRLKNWDGTNSMIHKMSGTYIQSR